MTRRVVVLLLMAAVGSLDVVHAAPVPASPDVEVWLGQPWFEPSLSSALLVTTDDRLSGLATDLAISHGLLSSGVEDGRFEILIQLEPAAGFLNAPVTLRLTGTSLVPSATESFAGPSHIDGYGSPSGGLGVIPEPTTLLLLGTGFTALSLFCRRRR